MSELAGPDPHTRDNYAQQMRDQIAAAQDNAAVIAVIDSDGMIAVTSPMGYGHRQVAAMLTLIGKRINDGCDADGIPELDPDEAPTEIPANALDLT